ncbi:predicted protein [Phaeodactylum tricornutum CCAP 1055/1]|jgi:uncharacterized protein|uniref:NADH dehydrogenase [ubiquinone] 1 alpha subcomplex assembly factor 3 n=2 Tax=Phaeodactylum tricornutum TaxID=2850 RepID=B5Y4N6_PHATC|nr:predicted protein [Phaeodactylum tricornutum CCAP 1055/1]ACI65795.1 predicted protein [Phaeodactylum tricornutum CCAP 1055/1]|eukprot:XP_002186325.1 predicted protein [Phaeodactylum tricornutum CCAP 1055/1]
MSVLQNVHGARATAAAWRLTRTNGVSGPRRSFSDWNERGHDITYESLTFGERPKIILQGYAPTGFDVLNTVKKIDENEQIESGTVHMNGSIMAFPFGCFLWGVTKPEDVTLESIASVFLHKPSLEYLFIGCNGPIPLPQIDRIKIGLSKKNCVVEKMNISNAIGTFNILNAEDRQVAVALILDKGDETE